ncbi:DUF1631 family protein [Variovorax sp. PCZ-1]|nr:DUF1631 family protein [Variovorax sp. PCZ-1]
MQRPANHAAIARQARAVFVEQSVKLLTELSSAIGTRLTTLFEQSANAREAQDRRDAMIAYQQGQIKWLEGTDRTWKAASQVDLSASNTRLPALNLELIGNEVVESKILSSRLSMRILDKSGWELNDLQVRMRMLDGKEELDKTDILRPEAFAQALLEQWLSAGLTQDAWLSVQDVIQQSFGDKVVKAYKATNEFLIAQGVMKEIDLRGNLKRTPNARGASGGGAGAEHAMSQPGALSNTQTQNLPLSGSGNAYAQTHYGQTSYGHDAPPVQMQGRQGPPATGAMSRAGNASSQVAEHIAKLRAQAAQYAAAQAASAQQQAGIMQSGGSGFSSGFTGGAALSTGGSIMSTAGGTMAGGFSGFADSAVTTPGRQRGVAGAAGMAQAGGMGGNGGGAAYAGGSAGGGAASGAAARPGRSAVANYVSQDEAYETRMQTAATPLARARMRAQGVMGQLKSMLVQRVAGFEDTRGPQMSPQLAAAFVQRPAMRTPGYQRTSQGGSTMQAGEMQVAAPMYVGVQAQIVEGMQPAQVNNALREQTKELKKVADTDGEKATIEIVALMFQSILSEERIPTGVRVWFARLQMPVLRLALSEPEFFGTMQHPARKLIDRMGSCVLGFDANVGSVELETEIKRIVQTIEQYPETGRRVFQLVFDEFEKFLSKFLTESKATAKVVSLAQQVEQKETAAIQYTIELRKMLGNLPLRDEIREFLFKVWAEVLALAAMKNGGQHESTLALKQVAADLLWAASAKASRAERAKVIADLPDLLKRLRTGMNMLGLTAPVQDEHIKKISDTLAEAFMSKTAAMDSTQVAEVAQRIKHLEDFVSEEEVGDLPLDAESIELMLGIDMTGVEIISEGGSEPTQAMRAWAMELERGSWFHLDHKGKMAKVQYSWRSKKGQLFLFADTAGLTYLFQIKRLAAYLQAGLIAPVEDETLTVRATRAALNKIDAQPDRLLAAA